MHPPCLHARHRRPWPVLVALLLPMLVIAPLAAQPAVPGSGLTEIPDPELDLMRGRYVIGDNQVLWFGVNMISSWQMANGQTLQGGMQLAMDFRSGRPVLTFTPNVTIGDADAPLPANTGARSIDSAGLANASGLVQSVQIAGDGNRAGNTTALLVRDGAVPVVGSAAGGSASARQGAASASAGIDGNGLRVRLEVAGQGSVEQWISPGSIGQGIRLATDASNASNQLQLELVRQSLPSQANLGQSVAQAINMTRGIGTRP